MLFPSFPINLSSRGLSSSLAKPQHSLHQLCWWDCRSVISYRTATAHPSQVLCRKELPLALPLSQQLHRQLPLFLWICCRGAARPGQSLRSVLPSYTFLLCSQKRCSYSWTLCYPLTPLLFLSYLPLPSLVLCLSTKCFWKARGRPPVPALFLPTCPALSQSWKVLLTATSKALTLLPANPFLILQANLLSIAHHLPL